MDNTRNISLNSSAIASFCSTTKALLLLVFSLTFAAVIQRAWATSASTTTTLTLTSGGTAVTTLTRGSVITLTATVTAGTAPVTPGQVDFCDASVSYCTDIHLFGTAQLTSAGTATLKLLPGNGTHVYKAVFRGTTTYSGSSSTSASLTVSGTNPSVTQFSGTNLTATVSGTGSAAPTGEISFVNASGRSVLATASLQVNVSAFGILDTVAPLPAIFANLYNPCMFSACLVGAGDFNNDGNQDIVFANSPGGEPPNYSQTWPGQIVSFLGDGKGNFSAAAQLALQGTIKNLSLLSVADFNGDGIPDVAVGDGTTGIIAIALGNGDGTFTSKGTISTGSTFSTGTVGDLNNDGIPDLVVVGSFVQIFNGAGDGTFTASTAATTVLAGTDIRIGDVNGDGIADLVVAGAANSGPITILLGNGDETFGVSQTLSYPGPVAIGDFNEDGKLDLISGTPFTGQILFAGYPLVILLGNGDGTFTTTSQTSSGVPECDTSMTLQTGNFTGTGHADVVAGCLNGYTAMTQGFVYVFAGNGNGTFGSPFGEFPGGSSSRNFAVADLNGDGLADVANGDYLGITVNQSSTATINNFTLPAGSGTVNVVAQYAGDSNYLLSASNYSIALTAQKGTPTVAVSASPNPAVAGASVTETVTVSGTGLTPTGSINLFDGSASLGTFTLNSSGVATYASSTLAANVHSITAQYAGDANYTSGTSSVLSLTINPNPFTVGTQSGGSTTSTVAAGQPATYSLSLSPAQGYSGTVSFTCSNLPANASCSFNPSSLNLTGNTPASFTLTIATQSQTTAAMRDLRSMSPLFACILLGLPFVSRRRRTRIVVLTSTILFFAIVGLSSCGGGSTGSGGTTNPSAKNVAPGTYTVQLAVSDGKNSQTQQLTLIVQ